MKGKKIICFALLIGTSQCFALEIIKGRLLEHKEWSTGNVKVFWEKSKTLPEIPKDYTPNTNIFMGVINSSIQPVKGYVNLPTNIHGCPSFFVNNDNTSKKTYNYTAAMCVTMLNGEQKCAVSSDTIELEPGGYARDILSPTLQLIFDQAGTYTSQLSTSVASRGDQSVRMSSGAEGTVTITNKRDEQSGGAHE